MMQVTFHTRVPDKLGYAVRLLRKAYRSGARVVVTADAGDIATLDKLLWTFDPVEFLPHVVQETGTAVPARLAATPMCLMAGGDEPPHHEVLVNLGMLMVPGFESFRRLIEVVSAEPDDAAAGRRRWKHYQERGYALEHHEVGA